MNNVTKKLLSLSMAICCGMSTLSMVACQPDNSGNSGNPNIKPEGDNYSTMSIGIFNGGFGYEWANQVAADFAEYYKDYSFEEGKKGVYVEVLKSKELYGGSMIVSRIENKLEKVDMYYTANEVQDIKHVSADITDIISEKVYDEQGNLAKEGEGVKSILDILDPHYQNQYNIGTQTNPVYKYLPYEDCLTGFIYDYDLFSENGWLTYSGLDGTPKYTDEFIDLCNKIVKAGYTPWTTSMDTSWYPDNFYQGFVMQYEGEQNGVNEFDSVWRIHFPCWNA